MATPIFPSWHFWFAPFGGRRRRLQRSVRDLTLSQLEQRFAKALPASYLAQNPTKAYSRKRVFTLARTVWCWLWQVLQAHTCCREVVRQVQALFALHDAPAVDEATGAYCQARKKLPQALLAKLLALSFESAEKAAHGLAPRLLLGRPIRVVDGSGAQLADTPLNRAAYPPSSNLTPGTGFPFLRIVALFSMTSGALLAQASGSLQTSELRLWLDLLPELKAGEILLADRAYGKYVIAALLQMVGVDFIATLATRSRKVDFRRAQRRLGPNDALFEWKKPANASAFLEAERWASLPARITVRLLRIQVARRGFRTEQFTLMTTLLDPVAYPAKEIIATHARRWRMEMCLDDLKTTLGMESLRCRKPEMVKKELLVFLTAHNLIRWLMAEAATHEDAELDSLSFKGALDACRQWTQAMAQRSAQRSRCAKLWSQLLRTIAADLLPWRPGRHEPRAVKKRSKYPHLNKPRHKFKSRWSRTKRRRLAKAKRHPSS
jgi:Transposase DDE domain